ncbi:Hypothetical protein R9X50_00722300 [Acrodontium crateriforme]|uniref:Enoyl-CoA hydratase n=1 Tax=Acrodontium crateriforme TaxID=150365 RepID=A0AAQ3RAK6_9PEZI|nr:Hypothetical protein R9X50_00722300 [Acrodontium crateriforme]
MLVLAQRAARRHGHQLLKTTSASYSTSLTSTIKISNIPAPHAGSITVLSLNRPKSRNALSQQLVAELNDVVENLHAEGGKGPSRALILASESDQAFCAGADLKERVTMSQDEVKAFLKKLRDTFTRLSTLPIPTISAISSTAFGGGLEIALSTNFRVLASTATVGLPETRLAILPGAGGTYRLPALIGANRARDLILTGRRVSGPEAYFLGICDRLVEVNEEEAQAPGVAREKVLTQAISMARDITEGGPIALKAALQAMNTWQQGETSENAAYDMVISTEDRMEGLRAFAEKRKPVYKGR